MYEFARGPLVWIAFIVLVAGSAYRLVVISRLARKDKVVFPYMNLKYGARSMAHWLVPYGTVNMRMHPAFTLISFVFHICLLLTPVLLLGHVVLIRESWGVSWWTLPEGIATLMTVLVVVTGILFAIRRLVDPTVRYVSSWSDFLILVVVMAPYVTGLLAYFQIFDYTLIITLHMISGCVLLMIIPFTRLIHMLLFPFTRAYMGSEFGFVRNARDW